MSKKYELVKSDSVKTFNGKALFRIRAKRAFGIVAKGELGGYIEAEAVLSHDGNAWVSDNARVSGDAWVFGNARVSARFSIGGKVKIDFEFPPRIDITTQEKAARVAAFFKKEASR